jgi:hypothetical protein
VSCGIGHNKHKEMLMFEVARFDIGYNCILRRPFLLKFMAVIHTAYATMKMSGPKGMITIKADQCDALAYENATLTYARRFGEKAAQEQASMVTKTHGSSTPLKLPAPKPLTIGTPRPPSAKKGTYVASTSNHPPVDQQADDKKKGADDKEVPVDPSNPDKKLQISTSLEAK